MTSALTWTQYDVIDLAKEKEEEDKKEEIPEQNLQLYMLKYVMRVMLIDAYILPEVQQHACINIM